MPPSDPDGWSADLAAALAGHAVVLDGVVGAGGSAIVYRGRDQKHDRPVAVKVFRPSVADELGADRFLREVQVAAGLRHPHILPLLDSGRTPAGDVYYIMPLADGQTLRSRLATGPMPVAEAVRLAREVAEALTYAHAEGLVHRDVKPENILIEGGHAVLADFGLAKRIQPSLADEGRKTRIGVVVGTPAYMSPEQLEAGGSLDGRSDVYSLGVTLFEMLAGQAPFEGATTVATLARRFEGKRLSVRAARSDVPAALDTVIARALEPDSADRFDSAAAFANALAAVEASGLSGGSRWPRRALQGLVAVLVLVALGAGIRGVRSPGRYPHSPRIVVADMANESGDPTLDPLGRLAGDVISAGLSADSSLDVVNAEFVLGAPRQDVAADAAGTSPEKLRALVDSTHAEIVISGSFYVAADRLEFFAEVTDTRTGRLVRAIGPVAATRARPEAAIDVVSDSVVRVVQALAKGSD